MGDGGIHGTHGIETDNRDGMGLRQLRLASNFGRDRRRSGGPSELFRHRGRGRFGVQEKPADNRSRCWLCNMYSIVWSKL